MKVLALSHAAVVGPYRRVARRGLERSLARWAEAPLNRNLAVFFESIVESTHGR